MLACASQWARGGWRRGADALGPLIFTLPLVCSEKHYTNVSDNWTHDAILYSIFHQGLVDRDFPGATKNPAEGKDCVRQQGFSQPPRDQLLKPTRFYGKRKGSAC